MSLSISFSILSAFVFLILGAGLNLFSYIKKIKISPYMSSALMFCSFFSLIPDLFWMKEIHQPLNFSWFLPTKLGVILSGLVLFVGATIHLFSVRYMRGEKEYGRFFYLLSTLTLSICLTLYSNHFLPLLIFWTTSNLILSKLIAHKKGWDAALASGRLARKSLLISSLFLGFAFAALYLQTGATTISALEAVSISGNGKIFAAVCLILAALAQSAGYPFHKWLLSSLNSPTPVSAMMHAGLINGGGILLVRFGFLFQNSQTLLLTIFILGFLSMILGTVSKLIQTEIKRQLACSTMGQMGFMFMQIGLGFFPAAIAHLVLHSFFKAFLFLNVGSALYDQKPEKEPFKGALTFIFAMVLGLFGAFCFSFFSHKPLDLSNTSIFLIFFCFASSAQVSYEMIKKGRLMISSALAILMSALMGTLYGLSVHTLEKLLPKTYMYLGTSMGRFHYLALGALATLWIVIFTLQYMPNLKSRCFSWIYVNMLNFSQPAFETITKSRNQYKP